MPLTAVVFDLDGLMVDTERLARRAWQQVLTPHGYRLEDEVYGRMIGRRTDEAARIFLDGYDLPLTPNELIKRKAALFEVMLAHGVPAMPGLDELQKAIARRGLPWAVATSSPRQHAQTILMQLGLADSCRAVAGGDEVAAGKPAPDIYLLAADRLGVAPTHCLALEDSVPGCQSAAAAGMIVAAIPNGPTKTAAFPCAHYRFNSLHDAAAALDTLCAD